MGQIGSLPRPEVMSFSGIDQDRSDPERQADRQRDRETKLNGKEAWTQTLLALYLGFRSSSVLETWGINKAGRGFSSYRVTYLTLSCPSPAGWDLWQVVFPGLGKLGLGLRGQLVKALRGSLGGVGLAAAPRGIWSGTRHRGGAQLSRTLMSRAGPPPLLPAIQTWYNKHNFEYE